MVPTRVDIPASSSVDRTAAAGHRCDAYRRTRAGMVAAMSTEGDDATCPSLVEVHVARRIRVERRWTYAGKGDLALRGPRMADRAAVVV